MHARPTLLGRTDDCRGNVLVACGCRLGAGDRHAGFPFDFYLPPAGGGLQFRKLRAGSVLNARLQCPLKAARLCTIKIARGFEGLGQGRPCIFLGFVC